MTTQTKHCANPNHPLEAHVPTAECGHEATTQTKQVWTPGPWTATEPRKWLGGTDRCKCSVRYGGNGNPLGNAIAEVYLGGVGALHSDAKSVMANARLISKAPEMAELLESFLVYLREFWPDEPLFFADQNTQAEVIAKAERLLADLEAV